jgi:hypothetical protein
MKLAKAGIGISWGFLRSFRDANRRHWDRCRKWTFSERPHDGS